MVVQIFRTKLFWFWIKSFSFSKTVCLTKVKELCLPKDAELDILMCFPQALALSETQAASSRIWTRLVESKSTHLTLLIYPRLYTLCFGYNTKLQPGVGAILLSHLSLLLLLGTHGSGVVALLRVLVSKK